MSDELAALVGWVNERGADPEVGLVIQRLGERGLTLEQLAESEPDEAAELCIALMDMVDDTYTDDMLHAYFKKNQPPRRYDPSFVLPDV